MDYLLNTDGNDLSERITTVLNLIINGLPSKRDSGKSDKQELILF